MLKLALKKYYHSSIMYNIGQISKKSLEKLCQNIRYNILKFFRKLVANKIMSSNYHQLNKSL